MDDAMEAACKSVGWRIGRLDGRTFIATYLEYANKHTLPFVGVTQEELNAGDKIRDAIHASQNSDDDSVEARRIRRKLEKSAKTSEHPTETR